MNLIWIAFIGISVSLFLSQGDAADTLRETFDSDDVSWRIDSDPKALRVVSHRRQRHMVREGKGAEIIQARVSEGGTIANFVHPLRPAVAIEDLTLSLWIRCNQAGPQLQLRLVFPNDIDPETGRAVTAILTGDRYQTPNEWQKLTCSATRTAMQDAIRRTRYRFGDRRISDTGLYVDQAIVSAAFGARPPELELLFDDLSFGPIVEPASKIQLATADAAVEEVDAPVEFRLNRLTVEGSPFFPIMAPYHGEAGETVESIASTGINLAWIKDYRDDDLIAALKGTGIWSTATPPRVETEAGEVLDAQAVGMLPFGPETRSILFWNLGPRIPSYTLDQLIGWVSQIQASDVSFSRPTLADVTDGEYAFSNHVDLLGVSRHITNTSINYHQYRDWLKTRRSEAFLNTFFWTWVQTEAASLAMRTRAAAGNQPIVIEPEQIRLQVYAALQAGCRGIGYWKTIPFDATGPGIEERRCTLARLNSELRVLEPLLATADRPGTPTMFSVAGSRPGSDGRRVRPSFDQLTINGPEPAETPFAPSERPPGGADAVLMKTEFGPLLIAVWYGESAQFCPGQMAQNNLQIVVPGVEETAAAWLITATEVRRLHDQRVAGGKQITLDKFDQTAAVLFTADLSVVERFRRAVAQTAPFATEATLELARRKRDRVAATHRELSGLADRLPDGERMLAKADALIARSESAFQRNDIRTACQSADDALQMLRQLQRAHWEDAVRQFRSPLASPHAVSFSTLPDHYRLIARVGRSIMNPTDEANVLASGRFEDTEEVLAEGWRHFAEESGNLSAGAALIAAGAHGGNYALELFAVPKGGAPANAVDDSGYVTFKSPAIEVREGEVLHISGWVNVVEPMAASRNGVTLHDDLLGPSSGLRWTQTQGWEPFQLLREVPEDGTYSITLTLHGQGRVHFDDLRVIPHSPRFSVAEEPSGRAVAR